MKFKHIIPYLSIVVAFATFSCQDDEPSSTIVGKWQGDKSEAKAFVSIVPVYSKTDEDFDAIVEFKSDNTGLVQIDGSQTSGTWEWVEVNTKLRTSIDFKTTFLEPTETYTIQELTATKLILYIEKEGTYEDPDSGDSFTGTIKATLEFNRMN